MSNEASVAAIQFALETDEGLEFLRLWNEGDFKVLRQEWPEAPEAVYLGADPLNPRPAVAGTERWSQRHAESLNQAIHTALSAHAGSLSQKKRDAIADYVKRLLIDRLAVGNG